MDLMKKIKMNNLNSNIEKKHILDIEEMKAHKVKAFVYIIMRVIIIAMIVLSLFNGRYENILTCILTLVLLMIPSFIEHSLKVELPSVLEVIMILFVFAANIMGEIGSFYEVIPGWDTALHTLNGFICAGVGFGLINILNKDDRVRMNLSPLFVCLFAFCFSMTVGTVWEFFEFGVDSFLGKDMQKDTVVSAINSVLLSGGGNDVTHIKGIQETIVNGKQLPINGYLDIGLIDTMKDLIVNFIGAVVFNVFGFIYLKGKVKSSFILNFIPTKIRGKQSENNNEDLENTLHSKK